MFELPFTTLSSSVKTLCCFIAGPEYPGDKTSSEERRYNKKEQSWAFHSGSDRTNIPEHSHSGAGINKKTPEWKRISKGARAEREDDSCLLCSLC